jgi:hypothetical protein
MGYDEYGLPDAGLIDAWTREIEPHWPAIVAVAALALAGAPGRIKLLADIRLRAQNTRRISGQSVYRGIQ